MDCYAQGMGMNSLCKIFKISINTLKIWIRIEGKEFKQPDLSEEKFVSCDEMWTFVEKKAQVVARLQRKTIKFSTSFEMLQSSVNLVINRYNNQLIGDAEPFIVT